MTSSGERDPSLDGTPSPADPDLQTNGVYHRPAELMERATDKREKLTYLIYQFKLRAVIARLLSVTALMVLTAHLLSVMALTARLLSVFL